MRVLLALIMVAVVFPAWADSYVGPGYSVTDNSIAITSSSRESVSGLTNVLALACGIPINDGATHTISNAPANSCFSGLTTLAQIAAITINGTQPFYFLTDSGTITGPMGTYGSTTNPFTSSAGAYALTNASVPNLDIAWLALQAANLTHKAYRPAGIYIIGSAVYLPLMVANVSDSAGYATNSDIILGDGPDATVIQAGQDWGAGKRIEWCGDPSGTSSNTLGRYEGNDGRCFGTLSQMSYAAPSGASVYGSNGAALTSMGGLSWGARLNLTNVVARGLNCGIGIVGDHSAFYNLQMVGGRNGICWDAPSDSLTNDNTFYNLNASGQTQNALYVDGAASIADTFVGETYISGAVDIGGNSNGCSALTNAFIVRGKLFTEYTGNRFMHDYNATSCRGAYGLQIENWQNSFANGVYWSGTNVGTGTRELFHVYGIEGRFHIQGVAGEQWAPDISHGTPPAMIETLGIGNNYGGLDISGEVAAVITELGSIPIISNVASLSGVTLTQTGFWSGGMAGLSTDGNYATSTFGGTRVGDLLELDQYAFSGGGRNYIGSSPIVGIVMQSGVVAGSTVPYANAGVVQVNTGWNTNFWNLWAKGTGIGPRLSLTAGSGYTNGTYTWTATAGCSTEPSGQVTVSGGALTSYTETTVGSGCTAIPTIPVPTGAGSGTGGAITAQWPGAVAITATNQLTVGYVGIATGGNSGVGNGGNYINMQLQGLH